MVQRAKTLETIMAARMLGETPPESGLAGEMEVDVGLLSSEMEVCLVSVVEIGNLFAVLVATEISVLLDGGSAIDPVVMTFS